MRLHVFEPRYLEMMDHVVDHEGRLAIAHLREGYQQEYFGAPPVHRMITAARILFADRLPDGRWNIAIEGIERAWIKEETQQEPFRIAKVEPLVDEVTEAEKPEIKESMQQVAAMATAIGNQLPEVRRVLANLINTHQHPGIVADVVAGALIGDAYARQSILEASDLRRRLQLVRIQLELLIEQLRSRGIHVQVKDEPGGK